MKKVVFDKEVTVKVEAMGEPFLEGAVEVAKTDIKDTYTAKKGEDVFLGTVSLRILKPPVKLTYTEYVDGKVGKGRHGEPYTWSNTYTEVQTVAPPFYFFTKYYDEGEHKVRIVIEAERVE